jgi:hypothetical protein
MADVLEIPQLSDSPQLDPILTNQGHRTTLGLMFWLGVMFDTLSAAMYQRPLVVSDEDSQTVSTSPSMVDSEGQIDLGCWDIPRNPIREKQDVWGDLFLRSSINTRSRAKSSQDGLAPMKKLHPYFQRKLLSKFCSIVE